MKRVSLVNIRSDVPSEQDLQRWIIDNDLQGIYVDRDLRRFGTSLWALIDGQIGETLESVFSPASRDIPILRVSRSTPVPLQNKRSGLMLLRMAIGGDGVVLVPRKTTPGEARVCRRFAG